MVAELVKEKRKNESIPKKDDSNPIEKQSNSKIKNTSKKKPINAQVIDLIKQKIVPVTEEGKNNIKNQINKYLEEKSLGLLILSGFNENGETDIKLDLLRTHERHIKETFKKIFQDHPDLKKNIVEILNEETNYLKNDKEILIKMVR